MIFAAAITVPVTPWAIEDGARSEMRKFNSHTDLCSNIIIFAK